ncbi:unnamed protein product [Calypogeia fissa]
MRPGRRGRDSIRSIRFGCRGTTFLFSSLPDSLACLLSHQVRIGINSHADTMITPRATAVAANSPFEEAGIETITLFVRWSASKPDLEVLVAGIATGLLGMANKVLYNMALVPMNEYPFFLAQMTTFGYMLVYFAFLFGRYKAGIVTDDMLSLRKGQFVALGALEAIGLATGMAAAAFLVWQLILSAAFWGFWGQQYTTGQIAGCLLVVTGVIIVVASGGGGTESLQRTGVFWPVVMILSALFSASGSILRESVFRNAKRDVKDRIALV